MLAVGTRQRGPKDVARGTGLVNGIKVIRVIKRLDKNISVLQNYSLAA
jgi:hypothetical protein